MYSYILSFTTCSYSQLFLGWFITLLFTDPSTDTKESTNAQRMHLEAVKISSSLSLWN